MRTLVLTVAVLLAATAAQAQQTPAVKNPTRGIFTCAADHDRHTGHELDILRADGTVLQTLVLGTAPADASGEVTLSINVQPIDFGTYTAKIRSVAGTFKSEDSLPSNVWERTPGRPAGNPKVQ